MTTAGLDLGTSLAKAVWGDPRQAKTLPLSQAPALLAELRAAGVTRLGVAGLSYGRVDLAGFDVVAVTGDAIERELEVQARGVRALLAEAGRELERFLVVSLGTGISYAFVDGDAVRRFPLGSAVGGGFLSGLSRLLGAASWADFAAVAAAGQPVDLRVEDQLPSTRGTPTGQLVLAHFGTARAETPPADAYASLLSTVATGVARDLALMLHMPDFVPPQQVVLVGSLTLLEPLVARLQAFVAGWLQREAVVLADAPYALAVGAQQAALG